VQKSEITKNNIEKSVFVIEKSTCTKKLVQAPLLRVDWRMVGWAWTSRHGVIAVAAVMAAACENGAVGVAVGPLPTLKSVNRSSTSPDESGHIHTHPHTRSLTHAPSLLTTGLVDHWPLELCCTLAGSLACAQLVLMCIVTWLTYMQ
jgi:hypothetical protein